MPRASLRWVACSLLVALLFSAALAGASEEAVRVEQPPVDAETGQLEAVGATVDETVSQQEADDPSALDEIGAALGSAAAAVADALATAAGAIGEATVAVGHGIAAAFSAIGNGLVLVGTGLWNALTWTGTTLWAGVTATATGIAWTFTKIGHGAAWLGIQLGNGIVWIGATLFSGLLAAGRALVTGTVFLGGLLADLGTGLVAAWPESPRNQAIVAGSAAGAAGAAGAAWYTRAWRYGRYIPFLAPLYTRLSKDELLDHPMRAEIHGIIEASPGIHVSELGRELDASWGTLLHHLDKLEKARLIVSQETSGKRCFFLPGQVPKGQRDILPALENETAHSIAKYFAENPGASQGDAASALGLSAALVSWHVKRLEKAGVLTRTREGRTKRVGVTETAMPALA